MTLNHLLKEITLVSFDLETSGSYPIGSSICEFAAVKWRDGKIIDTYQTLVKPPNKMSDFIIGIHGITNEMVQNAPLISEKIDEIYNFIKNDFLVAHHSPFDVGFLSYEFEKKGLDLPTKPIFCSSLLARRLFPESENHKLQTLIKFFNLPKGQAHRAHDDAQACLDITLKCFAKLGADKTVSDAISAQGKEILWNNFSINFLKEGKVGNDLVNAIEKNASIFIVYGTDPKAENFRPIKPHGIVRSPDGDYIHAFCEKDNKDKRFYLRRIQKTKLT